MSILSVNNSMPRSCCYKSLLDITSSYPAEEFKEALLSQKLPKNPIPFQVNGDLDLTECTGLTILPKQLTIRGNLYLSGCSSLISLPHNLRVEGNLYLNECTGLKTLPEGLTVIGNVYVHDTGITSSNLPNNINIKGILEFSTFHWMCWKKSVFSK